MIPLWTVEIQREPDVVLARQRAGELADVLGFEHQDATRIATAVSEVARSAFMSLGGGRASFFLEENGSSSLVVRLVGKQTAQRHPAVSPLEREVELGLGGARRLMDSCHLQHREGRIELELRKVRPRQAPYADAALLGRIGEVLGRRPQSLGALEEERHRNQELIHALEELKVHKEELARANQELEETNRGVMALYAELDARAEIAQRTAELKSRLLSVAGHEVRSPLGSIRMLAELLLDRSDGDLTEEQERQVRLIHKAASDLGALVDDLLDLSKLEVGKMDVRPTQFSVKDLFVSLRALLRPLVKPGVQLVFDAPSSDFEMETDEGKLSQILWNLVSNALKFTEMGEVRVSATLLSDDRATFSVADTGIGISPAHHELIFEEFSQVDSHLQRAQKGTGLGLPLTRRLSAVLGGSVTLASEPKKGSTFTVTLPRVWQGAAAVPAPSEAVPTAVADAASVAGAAAVAAAPAEPEPRTAAQATGREQSASPGKTGGRVLVVDDDEAVRYLLRVELTELGHEVIEAENGLEGYALALETAPDLVVLDLEMPGMTGDELLARLRGEPRTRELPVLICTARHLTADERLGLGEDVEVLQKGDALASRAKHFLQEALDKAGLPRSAGHASGAAP